MSDNKLVSLNEIFGERFFRIPDFQRGYSWGQSQLNDFWEDLINLKEDNLHYTGLLTVEPIFKKQVENIESWRDDMWLFESGFKAYYLIDGQQRLTTSIILINEILNKIKENEDMLFKHKQHWINKFLYQDYKATYKSYIFGYEKDNPSYEFFKTKILNQNSSTSDKVPELTLYTHNLEFAKEFFLEKISKIERQEMEILFKKIILSFKFNFYEIDKDLDVYTTFETMNNRGKPLSNLELLKNRLIYLTTMIEDNEESQRLRKDINESWKTIYEYIGKNKNSKLDDDDFLKDHWIMYFKYDRSKSEAYAKFLLNEYFTSKNMLNKKIEFHDIKQYVQSLQESVKYWFYIYNPSFSDYNFQTKEWFEKLNRLNVKIFVPLLMAIAPKHQEDDFLPTIKTIERFIFLVFRISQRKSNTANSELYRYANEFYMGNLGLQDLNKNIRYITDGENEKGEYVGWLWMGNFLDHIEDLYRKYNGFYDWNGLKYFLYEYELCLQQEANGDKKVSWHEVDKRIKDETIEHIYPQNTEDKYWKDKVDSYANSDIEKTRLLHSLGNLLLLSRSKNSKLQNKDFTFKKRHTNQQGIETGYFNGSYSEIEVAQNNDWTASDILERGKKMLLFIQSRWDINFDEWEFDVDKILGLNFLNKKQ